MAKEIDRRAARTRKALHEALMSLILSVGYEAVTIQDIIDEADVGRSTFYAHYTGKEDLLRRGFERLRSLLADEQRNAAEKTSSGAGALGFSGAMFEHACEYRHVYRALVGGRGGIVAVNEIRRILADSVRKEFPSADKADAIPKELATEFVVDTFLAVLGWSLGRKPHLDPPQMDAIFRQLVMHGIGPLVRTATRRSSRRTGAGSTALA